MYIFLFCSRFQRQSSEPCFGSLPPGGAAQRPFQRQNSEPSFLLFKQQNQPGHPFSKPYGFSIKEEMPDFGYENNGKNYFIILKCSDV